MDTFAATRFLTRFCARHTLLRGLLEPLYRHARHRGYKELVRENALRLLEEAHVEHLTGGSEVGALAGKALDHFEHLAGHGDPEAAYRLAEAHRTGFGRVRTHWLALEHFQKAADLGHPGARLRLQQIQDGEVPDDGREQFARQALLKATYGRRPGQRHRELAGRLQEIRQEGIGLRPTLAMLAAAGLILGYISLDVYFFGMGHWRPDPSRVVWGLFGKIHPVMGQGVGRVLPGWLRPDVRSVAFTRKDLIRDTEGSCRLGDFTGRPVFLHVIDGQHPMIVESVRFLRALEERRGDRYECLVVYITGHEHVADANFGIQMATEIAPYLADGPRALRPLGAIETFPMNFMVDRHGRLRQRWTGFSPELIERSLAGALAEP